MFVACFDLESTLMPEVWIAVADKLGIQDLHITTREEPDVQSLMDYRIQVLRDNDVTLKDFQSIVSELEPLDGAIEFIQWLQSRIPLIILSDALWPLIEPMIGKIGYPTTLCHTLEVDSDGFIQKSVMRIDDQKTKTILSLQALNYETIAVGDSFNDLGMLQFSNHSIIFNGSEEIKKSIPEIKSTQSYTELQVMIEEIL